MPDEFDAMKITRVVRDSIGRLVEIEAALIDFIQENLHEVRTINADAYNAAYGLFTGAKFHHASLKKEKDILHNIVALSDLLRIRVSLIDLITGADPQAGLKKPVSVYNSFYKIAVSMKPAAAAKRKKINMGGSSHERIQGYSSFDLIPYLMIDNAVKYSPEKQTVEVSVSERAGQIVAEVTNYGPPVALDELPRLWEWGFRSARARELGVSGSGIGLTTLKQLVEETHEGYVTFAQDAEKEIVINLKTYVLTTVIAQFPI